MPSLDDILAAPGPKMLNREFDGVVADLFPVRRPIEIEIGAGKGRFLLERAAAHRDRNFLGLDFRWRFLREGFQRAEARELHNLRFFKSEAGEVIEHLVPDASVEIFHIYFPDPWHKRKHHKRRLLTPDFFKLVHRRLVPGGLLELATDNFDYMVQFKLALVEAGDTLWTSTREARSRILDPHVKTHYEAKYTREGRPLYYMELQK